MKKASQPKGKTLVFKRRALLAAAGTLTLAGILKMIARCDDNPKPEKYGDWYRKNLAGAKGPNFDDYGRVRQAHTPEPGETALLEQQIEQRLGRKPKIFSRKYEKAVRTVTLGIQPAVLAEYVQRSTAATQEFFAYAGIPDRAPEITLELLTAETKMKPPSDDRIAMYSAWQVYDCVIGRYKIEVGGQVLDADSFAGKGMPSGLIKNNCTFDYKDDGIVFRSENNMPVLLTVGNGAPEAYTSPPAEALHFAIRRVRYQGIIDDINSWWKSSGRPPQLPGHIIDKTGQECLRREEGVVHALLDEFVEKRKDELGFTEHELRSYLEHTSRPEYAYVLPVREKVRKLGPEKVMRIYLENHRELFK